MKNYKLKKDKVSVLTIFCLTFVFVLVIALSFGTRFFFRPGVDDSFWGDLFFAFALVIYCLYFGVNEGKNYHQKLENGRYQTALSNFKSIREKVVERDTQFNQWLTLYYKKNRRDYFKAILSSKGNINPYVLDLDYTELDELLHPYKKVWTGDYEGRADTYFKSLTEEQLKVVKDIFNGKINVQRIPDDFFKTYNGRIVVSEYVEQTKAGKKTSIQTVFMVIYRIIALVIFQLVFALFGVKINEITTKEELLNQIITTLSRIINMITSFTYGYTIGKFIIKNQSIVLEYKGRVNNEFYMDKTFVGLSEEELAKLEYEQWEVQQNGQEKVLG